MSNIESLMMSNFCKFKRLNEKKLEAISKKHDLRKIDIEILVFLSGSGAKDTAKDIAATERFTKGHISQSVKRLSEKDFVFCVKDDDDMRVQHLKLTEAAMELLAEMTKIKDEMEACVFAGVTDKEIKTLETIFLKMHENIANEIN